MSLKDYMSLVSIFCAVEFPESEGLFHAVNSAVLTVITHCDNQVHFGVAGQSHQLIAKRFIGTHRIWVLAGITLKIDVNCIKAVVYNQ